MSRVDGIVIDLKKKLQMILRIFLIEANFEVSQICPIINNIIFWLP